VALNLAFETVGSGPPLLVLHGLFGSSPAYVTQRDGADFEPMFSQVEIEVLRDAGHWVHADQAEAFVKHVKRALKQVDRPTRAAHPL